MNNTEATAMDQETIDRVKAHIEIQQAFLRGEEVERRFRVANDPWLPWCGRDEFNFASYEYRVKPLKVEVGKLYRTCDGSKAFVYYSRDSAEFPYCFVIPGIDGRFWAQDDGTGKHDLDLISEWKD